MTAPSETIPEASADQEPGRTGGPGRWRRHRLTLLIAAALVLAIAVAVWTTSEDGGSSTERYDPANSGPDGAQAVARVLEDEGVDVSIARSAQALDDTTVDADTTVVVTSTEQLGDSTIERLLDHAGRARVILVEPSYGVTDVLGISESPTSTQLGEGVAAGCDDPLFTDLEIVVDSAQAYSAADGCFTDSDSSLVLEREGVTLFGAGQALTNDQVLRGDNAAVALRLLGQGEDLVWYVPSYEDLYAEDGVGVGSLIPQWVAPGLWVAAIAALFLILWRVRRLGPLSSEPLPVTVKAIETTRSRGRLYRKAGDRGHAAAALRAAARTRAVERLRLGPGHGEDALVRDLARHVGRAPEEIGALVGSSAPAPVTDRDLIHLAADLAELDREVRRT